MNETLSKAANSYENIIVIGDVSAINFVETSSLSKMINRKICHKNLSDTTINVMLTSRPNCFQKTSAVVSGLSNFHKMIVSCLKTASKTFHQKIFSEIIKSLMNKIFYTISMKQSLRENFIKRKICIKVFQILFQLL